MAVDSRREQVGFGRYVHQVERPTDHRVSGVAVSSHRSGGHRRVLDLVAPAYGVWMTGNLLLFASTSYILSTPRYALTLFPIFMLLAKLGRNQTVGRIISACSITLMTIFTASFVIGRWTF